LVKFILWFEREREKMTRLLGATKIDQPMTKKETGFVFFGESQKMSNVKDHSS
tara:strand:- start:238 stop:396 length:159 start_codon:yes stop_codon:yes gene_type:complete